MSAALSAALSARSGTAQQRRRRACGGARSDRGTVGGNDGRRLMRRLCEKRRCRPPRADRRHRRAPAGIDAVDVPTPAPRARGLRMPGDLRDVCSLGAKG
ncbi:MAG: hypothetical protein MUC68_03065 [Burkholderiaceae bacterium]|nr:hypothetical protein [Burkholderiaceae bacterium]